MSRQQIDVAVIGAGPYGLSIAAHLSVRNVAFRIFGTPMSSWRNHMAAGTLLKSFGFASSLYDPGSTFTLAHFLPGARPALLRRHRSRLARDFHRLRNRVSKALRPQSRTDRHHLAASLTRRLHPDHANGCAGLHGHHGEFFLRVFHRRSCFRGIYWRTECFVHARHG